VKIIGVDNVSPEQLKAELNVTNEVVRSMATPVAGVTRP
jgi:hypothetical protein